MPAPRRDVSALEMDGSGAGRRGPALRHAQHSVDENGPERRGVPGFEGRQRVLPLRLRKPRLPAVVVDDLDEGRPRSNVKGTSHTSCSSMDKNVIYTVILTQVRHLSFLSSIDKVIIYTAAGRVASSL